MRLTKKILTDLGAESTDAEGRLATLNTLTTQHGIDTPLRLAHFLAQLYHESTKLRRVEENLNYTTPERLLAVFGQRIAAGEAAQFVRQPKLLANRVYANRNGNGDDASGDGWRFRGRGLIQLTGRRNYRDFARWLGEDVVAEPERVAAEFAVHSAVFYWSENALNAPADADDVRAVTVRINGGLNGLGDRMQLLDAAKRLLAFDPAETIAALQPTHRVSASRLNIRNAPRVAPSTWIGALDQGAPVAVDAGPDADGWTRARVLIAGNIVAGFVAHRYLERLPEGETAPPAPAGGTPAIVHLAEDRPDVTRSRDGGRAHPLGEPGRPQTTAGDRSRAILSIAAWLDVENPAHRRYQPNGGATYCNIYAYDFCYLAGAFLPRVWWKGSALAALARGERPNVEYGRTVEELTANRLHEWLGEFGPLYGWSRVSDLDVLQAAANSGAPCLITAQRKDLDRPGHITVVIPEHAAAQAARNSHAQVLRPVESQAGRVNNRAVVQTTAWWTRSQFGAFGFWRWRNPH